MHRGRDSELCSLSEPKSRVSCSTSLQQMDSFSVFITEQCPHVHLHRSGVRIIHSPVQSFMLTSLYFPFDYRARILFLIEYASVTYCQEMGQVRTDTATLHPHKMVKESHPHRSGLRINVQSLEHTDSSSVTEERVELSISAISLIE